MQTVGRLYQRRSFMRRVVGLWIDHRKAVIVTIVGESKEIMLTMKSHMEPHVRFAGGSRSKAAHQSLELTAEDQRDRRIADHLSTYYDEVISHIREAEAILVFGPGEAKGELEKRLESKGLGRRVVGVEAIDKMTDRQIAAKVRQRFLE
jgi:DNA polymerase III delta prime subunit